MPKYRKLPVEIEAVQLPSRGTAISPEMADFLMGSGRKILLNDDGSAIIQTLEGNMKASPDDYIIKGIQGEYYPCKPDIFEATYESVSESLLAKLARLLN